MVKNDPIFQTLILPIVKLAISRPFCLFCWPNYVTKLIKSDFPLFKSLENGTLLALKQKIKNNFSPKFWTFLEFFTNFDQFWPFLAIFALFVNKYQKLIKSKNF